MNPSIEDLIRLQLMGYYVEDLFPSNNGMLCLDALVNPKSATVNIGTNLLEKELERGIVCIPYYDTMYYPKALFRTKGRAPLLIHLQGNKELLYRKEIVAIIGVRKADKIGCSIAYELAKALAEQGSIILSGLALGCDSSAYRGCLDVKVVASGLDITHPKSNAFLQQEIIDKGGLILSEQPLGVKANPTRLVARNRLQAILSTKVIVAQCPLVSGTMYAVEFTREYKVKIAAVQYDIYDELNSGNEYLLRQGIAEPIVKGFY